MTCHQQLTPLPAEALEILARSPCCGYQPNWPAASEPTALAAMVLLSNDRWPAARVALDWLADIQNRDGSVGIHSRQTQPAWPTGWAVLAWQTALRSPVASAGSLEETFQDALKRWAAAAERGVFWMRSHSGSYGPRHKSVGHDSQLRGWPWVVGTHSWLEPTAISVLALKAAGYERDQRSREAVELLLNRMLPDGGWNYGNTTVLGNTLRPHIQPTGLALAALYGEPGVREEIAPTLAYLEQTLSERTTVTSLCYALLGAAAHGLYFERAGSWLLSAADKMLAGQRSAYKLALLKLASLGSDCPWFVNGDSNS